MLELVLPSFHALADMAMLQICLENTLVSDIRRSMNRMGTSLCVKCSEDALDICARKTLSHIVLDVHKVDEYGPLLIKNMREAFGTRSQPMIAAVGAGNFPAFAHQLRDAGADIVIPSHTPDFYLGAVPERLRCIA